MKNLILLIITSGLFLNSNGQIIKNTLKYNNLSEGVTEVKATEYNYREKQKSVIVNSTFKYKYSKNGIMTQRLSEYYIFAGKYRSTYIIDKGRVIKTIFDSYKKNTNKINTSSVRNFSYKNGLLHKEADDLLSYTIKYEYNSKKQLISETKLKLGGIIAYKKTYEWNGKSYSSIRKSYSKGNLSSTTKNKFENGLIIENNYKSKDYSSVSTYFYNTDGDKLKEMVNGKLFREYNYEYDKKGNWIKKAAMLYNSHSGEKTVYLYFRELKYGNKTTGSEKFDVAFAKKYANYPSYEIKPFEKTKSAYDIISEDPSKIEKMLILKTTGGKFKAKSKAGNYLTNKVVATRHTKKSDMLLYHPKSNTTALMIDFNDEFTRKEVWMEATIISSEHSMFWIVNEDKNWFVVNKGLAFKHYKESKLKYSATNPKDVVLYLNGIPTYIMKNYKSAVPHKLYVLEKY